MIWTMPSTTLSVSILNSTLTSDPLSLLGHACLSVMMTREGTYGIRRRSIHRSAWKGNSANFAMTEFSEVRLRRSDSTTHSRRVLLSLYLLASYQSFEACDLLAGSQDDEGVAPRDPVRGRGGGVEAALPVVRGEDHRAGSLPDPELADGVVRDERVLRHDELLKPELHPLLPASHDVEEVHDQGLGYERGEPPSANGVGREGAVGPGYLELGGALVGAGPGDNVELGVQLAGREHDEDVIGVGVHGGDEAPCPPKAGLLEHVVVGGLAEQDQVALLHTLLYRLGFLLDNNEGYVVEGELSSHLAADPAVAAQDVVPV